VGKIVGRDIATTPERGAHEQQPTNEPIPVSDSNSAPVSILAGRLHLRLQTACQIPRLIPSVLRQDLRQSASGRGHVGATGRGRESTAVNVTARGQERRSGRVTTTITKGDEMHELERLIELARKRLPSEYITLERLETGWHLQKEGKEKDDLQDATFAQVLAKLREWAGEPEPEPEPMTVPELMALRDRASKQLGHGVTVSFNSHGASILTGGFCSMEQCTLDQVVAKLREWATPKLPEVTTLENVPVAWIQSRARSGDAAFADSLKIDEICRATMAKLQKPGA
jgi:hypothetical protein